MTERFLITGTGCSATKFTATALTAAGVRCAHERVISPRVALGLTKPRWGNYQAGCSWLATFDPGRYGVPVAHQLRHPLKVATSYLHLRFYDWSPARPLYLGHAPYRAVVAAWAPEVLSQPTEVDRVLSHMIRSFDAAQLVASLTYRIEDMNGVLLRRVAALGGHKIDPISPRVAPTTNTHRTSLPDEALVKRILGSPLWPEVWTRWGEWYH
jgi:hypothetical protein